MIDMFFNSIKLFAAGKLFRDNSEFFRLWGMATLAALALIAGLSFINPWLGAMVGGAAGGALVPWLFRNLKFN